MIELHTWGPGFGLPSIETECLATITYLQNVLSKDSWLIVPSNNPNSNPFQRLPALKDASIWVAGFDHIQQYISDHVNGAENLDGALDNAGKADRDAYTAFLFSKGLPLLDLSFYISSDNYTNRTRKLLGDMLTWPQSWILPHQLREQARRRSEHLGLGALDVDTAQENEKEDAGLTAHIPKSLRKPKQTVSSLLGRTAQKTRFRLDAVMDDFFEPLQKKLRNKAWLLGDRMSSTDCVAIALISLMQVSEMPQPFLQEALSTKYSGLNQWAGNYSQTYYGRNATSSAEIKTEQINQTLTWAQPPSPSWIDASCLAMEVFVGSVPLLRDGYQHYETNRPQLDRKSTARQKQDIYARIRSQQQMYSQVITGCIGTTSVLGWMIYAGILTWPLFSATKPSRRNFGEAGALLGL